MLFARQGLPQYRLGQYGKTSGRPRGELLGRERVAMRARERRVDLVVTRAEKRVERVGVEGGARAGARPGHGWGVGHGGGPTKPGGTTFVLWV